MKDNNRVWKHLKSTYAGIKNPLFEIRQDQVINPRNQKPVEITVLTGNDAANVVPITKDGNIVMVEQYRFGIQQYTLEIPGGMVDDGEDHRIAVERELLEETGYSGTDWHFLGSIPSNPVFQDQYIHHYLLKDAVLTGSTSFDDAEDIFIKEVPLTEAMKLLKEGKIEHPHIVNALFRAFLFMGLI